MNENVSIAAIVATVISLMLEWFPGVKTWWDKFAPAQKQGLMALIVALVSVVTVAGNCYWWGEVCPDNWAIFLREVLLAFLAAAAVNQGVHMLSKRP